MSNQPTNHYLVQEVIEEGRDIRSYVFSWGTSRQAFKAGQFMIFGLPDVPDVTACLTLASAPRDEEGFRVTVKRTGDFGTRFYDTVKELAVVPVVGAPRGVLCREEGDTRPIWFLGRDYTIPAARSMLYGLLHESASTPFTLLHECTSEDQALYRREWDRERFPFLTIYSPHDPAEGFQTEELRAVLADQHPKLVYAVGEGVDVKRWRNALAEAGVSKEELVLERWS